MMKLAETVHGNWRRHDNQIAAGVLAIVVCFLLAAPSLALDLCARISVSGDLPTTAIFADGFEVGSTDGWLEPAPAFRATEILDVVFEVEIEGVLEGVQVLELRIVGPNGSLFRTLSTPLTADPRRAGDAIRLNGFPHPVRLAVLETREQVRVVDLRFPVAGTSIVSNSVYGIWQVAPLIDGIPVACGGESTRFVLVP